MSPLVVCSAYRLDRNAPSLGRRPALSQRSSSRFFRQLRPDHFTACMGLSGAAAMV